MPQHAGHEQNPPPDASVRAPVSPGDSNVGQALSSEVAAHATDLAYATRVTYATEVRNGDGASQGVESVEMETLQEFHRRRREVIRDHLVALCAERGVSQSQLARQTGATHRMVWDWMHAEHAPSERYLRRLEKVLDVPRGFFTAETDEKNAA